ILFLSLRNIPSIDEGQAWLWQLRCTSPVNARNSTVRFTRQKAHAVHPVEGARLTPTTLSSSLWKIESVPIPLSQALHSFRSNFITIVSPHLLPPPAACAPSKVPFVARLSCFCSWAPPPCLSTCPL
ncbi:unnamed protein product, partial [Ectocarpus sp. 13 AM-2016]